jgi:hypothetical protein
MSGTGILSFTITLSVILSQFNPIRIIMNNFLSMHVVFWDAAPCSLVDTYRRLRGAYCLLLPERWVALMMDTVSAFETSVSIYQTTRRSIPEDSHLHTRRHGNQKYHITLLTFSIWGSFRRVLPNNVLYGICCFAPKIRILTVVTSFTYPKKNTNALWSYVLCKWLHYLVCYFVSYIQIFFLFIPFHINLYFDLCNSVRLRNFFSEP